MEYEIINAQKWLVKPNELNKVKIYQSFLRTLPILLYFSIIEYIIK